MRQLPIHGSAMELRVFLVSVFTSTYNCTTNPITICANSLDVCRSGNSYGSLGTADCPSDCSLPGSTGCGNRNAVYHVSFESILAQTVNVCEECPAGGTSYVLGSTDPADCRTCQTPSVPADSSTLHPTYSSDLPHCILSPQSKTCEEACLTCSAESVLGTEWLLDARSAQARVAAVQGIQHDTSHQQTTSAKSCSQLCSLHGGAWCSDDSNIRRGSDLTCGESNTGLERSGVHWGFT
jgi:hypothetical protein